MWNFAGARAAHVRSRHAAHQGVAHKGLTSSCSNLFWRQNIRSLAPNGALPVKTQRKQTIPPEKRVRSTSIVRRRIIDEPTPIRLKSKPHPFQDSKAGQKGTSEQKIAKRRESAQQLTGVAPGEDVALAPVVRPRVRRLEVAQHLFAVLECGQPTYSTHKKAETYSLDVFYLCGFEIRAWSAVNAANRHWISLWGGQNAPPAAGSSGKA